ncbi:MAG: hypothetical protein RR220_09430, partial [Bacteroidaceae bacterium]
MERSFLKSVFCIFLLLTLAACSVTKFVPEGKYLLDEVKITSDNKEIKAASLRNYVRQHPNSKWFSLLKIPLYTYNLSGSDSSKWCNRFFRR